MAELSTNKILKSRVQLNIENNKEKQLGKSDQFKKMHKLAQSFGKETGKRFSEILYNTQILEENFKEEKKFTSMFIKHSNTNLRKNKPHSNTKTAIINIGIK